MALPARPGEVDLGSKIRQEWLIPIIVITAFVLIVFAGIIGFAAVYIYGRLRETWERALEEVLLGGVVERFRNSVESQRVRHLSDITDEDCSALGEGMTKSSRWLAGHDQAAAENVSVPNPDELQEDISALEVWVSRINRRRKSR